MKKILGSVLVAAGVLAGGFANAADETIPADMPPAKHEFKKMTPEEMKAKREEMSKKFFDKMDTNKDGVISQEEHDAFVKNKSDKRFEEMDTNKDGKITKEEFDASKKKMHDKRGKGMGKGMGNPGMHPGPVVPSANKAAK